MLRRLFRAVFLGGLVAAGVAAYRAMQRQDDPLPQPATAPRGEPWPPLHNESPAPDEVAPETKVVPEPGGVPVASGSEGWVEPDAEGGCPDGFPIKAKMSSKIFHSPGQLNYDRTTPDRCYVDAAAAEADGLRPAKR